MDIDAAFFSKLLTDKSPKNMQWVRKAFFEDSEWGERYTWVRDFYRQHGQLPTRETFEVQFKEKLPDVQEPITYYADEIRKRALYNELTSDLKAKTIKALEGADPDKALSTIKLLAAELTNRFIVPANASAMNLHKTIKKRWKMYKEREEQEGMLGIATPWESLNEATLGFCDGDCIFILAKSSVGKTWIALILSDYAQKQEGKNVLFVSQEMPPERMSMRADAVGAKVSALRFRSGELTDEEKKRYKKYLKEHNNKDNGWGQFDILGQKDVRSSMDLEIAIDTYAPDLVIWDSFYLVADKKWEEQAKLVQDIKRLAEDKMVPIIGTGQFNRLVGGEDLKADQNAAAGTQAVIQDADIVLGLFRTAEMTQANEMLMSSLKVRDGVALDDMTFNWDLHTMEFHEKASVGSLDDDAVEDDEYGADSFYGD